MTADLLVAYIALEIKKDAIIFFITLSESFAYSL
jgi:hypothetical protein